MPIAPSPPTDLCGPRPGSTTARAVITMATRALYDAFRGLRPPPGADPDAVDAFERARAAVSALLPGRPKVVAALLRGPTAATPIRRVRDGIAPVDAALVDAAGQLLFALSITGELPIETALARAPARLVAPAQRRVIAIAPGVRSVRFGRGRLELDGRTIDLARHAPSDLLMPVTLHTVLSRVHGRPSEGPPMREAAQSVAEAFALLETHLPALRAELDLFLPVVVPGYAPPDPTAIGVGQVDLRGDAIDIALDLIRTHTEQKMHAFMELDPLVGGARPRLVRAAARVPSRALLVALGDRRRAVAEGEALREALGALRDVTETACGVAVLSEMRRALGEGPA